MKRIKLGLCILLVLFLTGCIKYDISNTVGTDKKFTLTIFNGLLNEYYSKDSLSESEKKYKELGYKVTDSIGNKYSGLKLTKEYASIDDISTNDLKEYKLMSLLETNVEDIKLFKVEKNGNISKYTANLIFDVTAESVSEQTNYDYGEYAETMYFGYSIALPTNATVISHNADKTDKDNHILMWEIKYGTNDNINFVFEIDTSKSGENNIIPEIDKSTQTNNESNTNPTTPTNDTNDTTNNTNNKENNFYSTILSFGFIIIIVAAFIYLKKGIKKAKKKKIDDPTIIYHKKPPKG